MKVRSLVECVQESKVIPKYGELHPVKGSIYTVRSIHKARTYPLGVMLDELINPIRDYIDGTGEVYFNSDYFREIQPPMDLTELLEETITELA